MFRTNPYRGWNKIDAVRCQECGTLHYLTGKGRNRRFFTVVTPMILAALGLGSFTIAPFDGLHWPNDGPNASAPNLLDGLILVFFFLVPALVATNRFEDIAIEPEPDA
ncbi:hypothetical protein [Tritonibacter multivorans]|nr:hypothetical protein [Tritonibacter multivorans]MDA7419685.1 hypothetical protein [Tritonibacter multivorans]